MNWNEILNLSAWTPLSQIGNLDIEPIVDGVFRVGVDAYLRTQQYNELLQMGDSRAPFVTMAYWSPSVDGLKRLILGDPSICVAKPIPAPPPELAMGMTGRYLELAKQAPLMGQRYSERAVYSNKGVFLKKLLSIGPLGYCFMDRKERDEHAFAIEISLRK